MGAAAGAVLIGAGLYSDLNTTEDYSFPAAVLLVPAAVVMAGLGAVIGAVAAPRRWSQPVMLPSLRTGPPN